MKSCMRVARVSDAPSLRLGRERAANERQGRPATTWKRQGSHGVASAQQPTLRAVRWHLEGGLETRIRVVQVVSSSEPQSVAVAASHTPHAAYAPSARTAEDAASPSVSRACAAERPAASAPPETLPGTLPFPSGHGRDPSFLPSIHPTSPPLPTHPLSRRASGRGRGRTHGRSLHLKPSRAFGSCGTRRPLYLGEAPSTSLWTRPLMSSTTPSPATPQIVHPQHDRLRAISQVPWPRVAPLACRVATAVANHTSSPTKPARRDRTQLSLPRRASQAALPPARPKAVTPTASGGMTPS